MLSPGFGAFGMAGSTTTTVIGNAIIDDISNDTASQALALAQSNADDKAAKTVVDALRLATGVSASQLAGTEASLAAKLASKADETAVNTLRVATGVSASQLAGTEASLAVKLASKADETALNTLRVATGVSASQLAGTEASLAVKLALKADQTALNTLETTVNGKAAQTALDTVQDVADDALALAQQNQSTFNALSAPPIAWLESPEYDLGTHPDNRYVVMWEHGQNSEPLMAQLFVRVKDTDSGVVTYVYPYTDYKVQMRYSLDDLRGRAMNRLLLSFEGNDLDTDPSYRIVNTLIQNDRVFNNVVPIALETYTNAINTNGVITPIIPTLPSSVEFGWNPTEIINLISIRGEHLRRNNARLTVTGYYVDDVVFSETDPSWITTSALESHSLRIDTTKRIEVCFDNPDVTNIINTLRAESNFFGAGHFMFIRALFNSSVAPTITSNPASAVGGVMYSMFQDLDSLRDPLFDRL
jgi:hypothetical protein